MVREGECTFGIQRPIGIDKQAGVSNRLARDLHPFAVPSRVATDFHLYPSAAVLRNPGTKLLGEFPVSIVREAAAAINRYVRMDRTKQPHQREVKQLGLQVPQRGIHCGNRR